MKIRPDMDLNSIFENTFFNEKTIKKIVLDIFVPIRNRQVIFEKGLNLPRGVLFIGPEGSGKKTLTEIIKNVLACPIFETSASEILSAGSGKAELSLINKFDLARKKSRAISDEINTPGLSIIIIKDLDSLAVNRTSQFGQSTSSLVSILLGEIDRLSTINQEIGYVFLIGTITNIEKLDPEIRTTGRFEMEIFLSPPNETGRLRFFKKNLPKENLEPPLNHETIAQETPGFSGSDLKLLIKNMTQNSLIREIGSYQKLMKQTLSNLRLSSNSNFKITPEDFLDAKNKIVPSGLRDKSFENPNVAMNDVYGLHKSKQIIQDQIINYMRHKDAFKRLDLHPIKGIIFYGPPGNGKTMLAKAIATEVDWNFLLVSGPELLSKFVGESEESIRYIFQKVRQLSPCIIFFDELDSVAPPREKSSDTHVYASVVGQLLAEIDGLRILEEVIIIGATNRIDLIDKALLREGRLDFKLEVPIPSSEDRKEFIQKVLEKNFMKGLLEKEFNIDKLSKVLSESSSGYSGAALNFILTHASRLALKRSEYSKNVYLKESDYLESFKYYESTRFPLSFENKY